MYWQSANFYIIAIALGIPVTYFAFVQIYYIGLWHFDCTPKCGLPGRSGYADLDANHEGLIEGVIAPFRYWYTCGVRPTGKAGGAERSCPALGVNMRG